MVGERLELVVFAEGWLEARDLHFCVESCAAGFEPHPSYRRVFAFGSMTRWWVSPRRE